MSNQRPSPGPSPLSRAASLRVVIIAGGESYQEAAAWAAPTYARFLPGARGVSVLVPQGEAPRELLAAHAQRFGFSLLQFPFQPVSEAKFTSQLKCQGFQFAVSRLRPRELLFLVDADTYCLKPLNVSFDVEAGIREGKIGLVPDIVDRHFDDPAAPWYLAPRSRAPYVNSGVILASRRSLPLFQAFRRLSEQPLFLRGPFNDQKVLNYALGKLFKDRLLVLDPVYNGIRHQLSPASLIGHCTGGAGRLGGQSRKRTHREICAKLLGGM